MGRMRRIGHHERGEASHLKPRMLSLLSILSLAFILFFHTWAAPSLGQPERQNADRLTSVKVYEEPIIIRTYLYEAHLSDMYSSPYNMTFKKLNWDTYLKMPPKRADRMFKGIVLENEYLKLTILPELGGRIYECIFKVTGHNEFYRNPVLKPTRWGPPEQGWWLAAGGIEWCLPVEEHGYESAQLWLVETSQSPAGATVTITDSTDAGRLVAWIEVHLPADSARFSITPHLKNLAEEDVEFQFWINAMLAPGGTNAPSEQLEFIYPTEKMTVHSRDDRWTSLPASGEALEWPIYRGLDLSILGNWLYYLGCFERPAAMTGFVAVYDHRVEEGIVRVFPSGIARGAKVFAAGIGNGAIPPELWTDDRSSYVEMHGGLTPTFGDYASLAPGEQVSWTEYWYPIEDLGGVVYANQEAALNLEKTSEGVWFGITTTSRYTDTVASLNRCADNHTIFRETIPLIDPSHPYRTNSIPAQGIRKEDLCLSYLAPDGSTIASY